MSWKKKWSGKVKRKPRLQRWARGEGRLEMREQGEKAEAKDHNSKNNQEGVEDKRQSQQQLGTREEGGQSGQAGPEEWTHLTGDPQDCLISLFSCTNLFVFPWSRLMHVAVPKTSWSPVEGNKTYVLTNYLSLVAIWKRSVAWKVVPWKSAVAPSRLFCCTPYLDTSAAHQTWFNPAPPPV